MSDLAEIDKVRALEEFVLAAPQVDLRAEMFAHGGLGARTIFVPAGTVLTGALTNLDNVCIVSGDISVTTQEGVQRLVGYHVLKACSGFKRAGYAHADTYWTTLWRTDLTNATEMEDEMTNESAQLQTRRAEIVFAEPVKLEE